MSESMHTERLRQMALELAQTSPERAAALDAAASWIEWVENSNKFLSSIVRKQQQSLDDVAGDGWEEAQTETTSLKDDRIYKATRKSRKEMRKKDAAVLASGPLPIFPTMDELIAFLND